MQCCVKLIHISNFLSYILQFYLHCFLSFVSINVVNKAWSAFSDTCIFFLYEDTLFNKIS
jgi:hypothetical protein